MEFPHTFRIWGCRIFQAIFKIADYAIPYRLPEYLDGSGSIRQLPDFLKEKNVDHILIVTDRGLMQLGLLNSMFHALDQAGIHYACFSDLGSNPTTDDVEKGYHIYRENGCRAIVAFGGGSPIDCAKAIGAKAAHPKRTIPSMQGLLRVLKPIPPLFAIPTTSGTGSETTLAAVITDSATHRKASLNDPFLIPKYAILDPELTAGLPPHITAITGMDALCHAVESYTNQTYNTPIENDMAKKAVKLIYDNLLIAYHDGKNLNARQNMQFAALYAGRAFTRGCVGYVHAIGHTLGGLYGVPHGLAMSVLLPHVMREFGASAHKRLADLADVCGIGGANEAEKANNFIRWIEETNEKMGLPNKFDVIQDKDIDQMITWAAKEANPLYPVPVVWARKDFRRVIEGIRK